MWNSSESKKSQRIFWELLCYIPPAVIIYSVGRCRDLSYYAAIKRVGDLAEDITLSEPVARLYKALVSQK